MRGPKAKSTADKLVAGIDLHSNNVMIGVMNQDGKRVDYRKVDCSLKEVLEFLEPLKPQLQSLAVESTFNAAPSPELEAGPIQKTKTQVRVGNHRVFEELRQKTG